MATEKEILKGNSRRIKQDKKNVWIKDAKKCD